MPGTCLNATSIISGRISASRLRRRPSSAWRSTRSFSEPFSRARQQGSVRARWQLPEDSPILLAMRSLGSVGFLLLMVALLACRLSAAPAAAQADSLLGNGDFERSTDGMKPDEWPLSAGARW